jgi:hypothetical protein
LDGRYTMPCLLRSTEWMVIQLAENHEHFSGVRLSGWALMLGGVIFGWGIAAASLQSNQVGASQGMRDFFNASLTVGTMYLGPYLIAMGLLGLGARCGERVGMAGKNALLLGALGGFLSMPAALVVGRIMSASASPGVSTDRQTFQVFAAGLILMFACLAAFGGLAAHCRAPLSWAAPCLLGGVGFLLFMIWIIFIEGNLPSWPLLVLLAEIGLSAGGLVAAGYALQAAPAGEAAPPVPSHDVRS